MENNYAEDYGKCSFCGAPKVKSPKTGKVFCSEKCWLKGKAPQESSPTGYARAEKQVQNVVSANINKFEAGKEANMKRMASGRDATLIVVAEMTQGSAWSEEDIKKRIQMYAKWFEETIYGSAFIG